MSASSWSRTWERQVLTIVRLMGVVCAALVVGRMGAGGNRADRHSAAPTVASQGIRTGAFREAFCRLDATHQQLFASAASQTGHRIPVHCCLEAGAQPDWNLVAVIEAVLGGGIESQSGPRWTSTATGGTGAAGDPITLRYSFVPDGTVLYSGVGETAGPSTLFATFDQLFQGSSVWTAHVASVFASWSELSGVSFVFEPNDDGAATGLSLPGVVGIRGDIRIGGHPIDGPSATNIVAYASYPNFGDIVFDTTDLAYFGNLANNALHFRNVCAHEIGHVIGLGHVCPWNATKLMEPFLSSTFDGPQNDDVQGAQRHYGDRLENNDSRAVATDLGLIPNGPLTVSNLSCDGSTDSDWYRFTVNGMKTVSARAVPVGSTYLEGPQLGGPCSPGTPYNSLAANDLSIEICDGSGSVLATANSFPAGLTETISDLALPASAAIYYVHVVPGTTDAVQVYGLELSISDTGSAPLTFTGAPGDRLGQSIANAGDVNADGRDDVIAGAPTAQSNGVASGLVRVYSGADGSLLRTFYGAGAGDLFGQAVAGAGDVDADGFADILVGAPGADSSSSDAGQVSIFSGLDGSLILTVLGSAASDELGCAVGAVGDVNLDGRPDFIVGARFADPAGTSMGRARVYSGLDGSTLYTFSGSSAGDQLGSAVAGAGDIDGDGIGDLMIGVPFADANGMDSGQVRVHSGATGALLLTIDGAGAGAQLGHAVAGAGDVDGDGRADVVAGAPHDGLGGTATVYSGLNGVALFVMMGVAPGDELGLSVAPAGDVDLDGFADVVVGSPGFDVAGIINAGSAQWQYGPAGTRTATIHGAAAFGEFGFAVAGGGDLGTDGFSDSMVGAPGVASNGSNAGAVWIYRFPLGSASGIGAGCGAQPTRPILMSTVPSLGSVLTIAMADATPNATGALVGSFGATAPTDLGRGCTAYVDLANFIVVVPIAIDPAGQWIFTTLVPFDNALAGVEVVLQAVVFPTMGPLGSDITNGIQARLGY